MNDATRYDRGLAKLIEIYGDKGADLIASLQDIAPDLGRYVVEFAFGDIHCRPDLDPRSREIATVAALTAMGTAPTQLRAHIHAALNVGCSEKRLSRFLYRWPCMRGFRRR